MRNRFILGVLFVGLLAAAAPKAAYAEEEETGNLIVTKLFRGIANASTGWMELFKQPSLQWQEGGAQRGLSWGVVKGVGYAIARSVGGAYEIVTFPLAIPDGYKPIMKPDYVLSDMESSKK